MARLARGRDRLAERAREQIVIHPRCKRTEEKFRLYRYKTDPVTGDVLPIIVDKHNHAIDTLRYALQPAICVPEQQVIYEYSEVRPICLDMEEFNPQGGGR